MEKIRKGICDKNYDLNIRDELKNLNLAKKLEAEREKQMKQGAGQATKVRKHMIENKREVRRGRGRKQVFKTNGNQGKRKQQIRRVTGMNETTQKTTR